MFALKWNQIKLTCSKRFDFAITHIFQTPARVYSELVFNGLNWIKGNYDERLYLDEWMIASFKVFKEVNLELNGEKKIYELYFTVFSRSFGFQNSDMICFVVVQ